MFGESMIKNALIELDNDASDEDIEWFQKMEPTATIIRENEVDKKKEWIKNNIEEEK